MMSFRLTLLLVLVACPLLSTGQQQGEDDFRSFLQDSSNRSEDDSLQNGENATDATNVAQDEPLNIEPLVDAAESFLPAKISVFVIGVLTTIKLAHDNIQAAFKNMPGNSCIFLFSFLGMFCWTVLALMWDLDEDMLDQLGNWTTVSSYIATMNLMLTPLILVIPDQKKTQKLAHAVAPKVQEKVQKTYENNKMKLSVLYLCVMLFQITSAVSVFHMAETKQARIERSMKQLQDTPGASGLGLMDSDVEDITGPVMATLLYVILSWCSLGVLYERMFPKCSFAADFPVQVLQNAFPCIASFVGTTSDRADQLKSKLDDLRYAAANAETRAQDARNRMEERLSRVGMQVPLELQAMEEGLQAARDSATSMSSAATSLRDSFLQEAEGITVQLNKFVQAVDSHQTLYYIHYAIYVAYGVGALVFSGWLGSRIVEVAIKEDTAAAIYLIGAMLILLSFFSIICVVATCGGFSGVRPAPVQPAARMSCLQAKEDVEAPEDPHPAPEQGPVLPEPDVDMGDLSEPTYGCCGPTYVDYSGCAVPTYVAPEEPTCVGVTYALTYDAVANSIIVRLGSIKERIARAEEDAYLPESLEKELISLEEEFMRPGPLLPDISDQPKIDEIKQDILSAKKRIEALRLRLMESTDCDAPNLSQPVAMHRLR